VVTNGLRSSSSGGWPIFALHHSHRGRPILAFFARVGGDAADATPVRSTLCCVCRRRTRPFDFAQGRLFAKYLRTRHPHLRRLLQFEKRPDPPTLRFPERTRVALRSDLAPTIIKTPTSYFACASFATTAATLSSIWFQPSN
jgi:hypothetical protein